MQRKIIRKLNFYLEIGNLRFGELYHWIKYLSSSHRCPLWKTGSSQRSYQTRSLLWCLAKYSAMFSELRTSNFEVVFSKRGIYQKSGFYRNGGTASWLYWQGCKRKLRKEKIESPTHGFGLMRVVAWIYITPRQIRNVSAQIFSCVHATLRPAFSVRLLVHMLVHPLWFSFYFFGIYDWLLQYCSCPARNLSSFFRYLQRSLSGTR